MQPKRFVVSLALLTSSVLYCETAGPEHRPIQGGTLSGPAASPALWQDPGDIASRNLMEGPAGKPTGPFRFLGAMNSGTAPKFKVKDSSGTTWIAKVGPESRSETAAARLMWAIGYKVDDDYFLPEIDVENLSNIPAISDYVYMHSANRGLVTNVRLERMDTTREYTGAWSWHNNPYQGSREMNGLRVMMALLNNWDLKKSNNSVYQQPGKGTTYQVADLGATFGKTGDVFTRSKSNLKDYERSAFVKRVDAEYVDFNLNSRPNFITLFTIFYIPEYVARTKMEAVAKNVPIVHARWVGSLLAQLSDQQLLDCFTSAGYSKYDAGRYAELVRERIHQLAAL
jgi:hypothetical protein